MKGGVHSKTPPAGNAYNQNFSNRFCGCSEVYDAHKEKGTMYQCLGLGGVENGGCGEDWWHPECIVGLPRNWYNDGRTGETKAQEHDTDANTSEDIGADTEEPPQPPGFPHEDDFDAFICYKCVEANPWIKRYAGTDRVLPAVYYECTSEEVNAIEDSPEKKPTGDAPSPSSTESSSKKRKADPGNEDSRQTLANKKQKNEPTNNQAPEPSKTPSCRYATLPTPPTGKISLFLKEDFREHLCHCPACFPPLAKHPQLLEEEDIYEPPLSESGEADGVAGGSVGTGSLLERGQAALSNMDRVRAIGKSNTTSIRVK